MGPNGPALLTSHVDASALLEHPHLLKAIGVFSKALLQQTIGIGRLTKKQDGSCISRIAFIAEGGGKTRLIAIGDFFTQNALLGIHNSLMRILGKLETDGTWNQDNQSERIRTQANDQSVSFDLKSATDRFPVSIQKDVIGAFYGKEVSEA